MPKVKLAHPWRDAAGKDHEVGATVEVTDAEEFTLRMNGYLAPEGEKPQVK